MNIIWRQLLKGGIAAGIGMFLLLQVVVPSALAFNQSPQIPLFKTALRGVGPGQIPVAAPGPLPAPVTGVTHYQMLISQFQDQILPPGFNKTTLWGYNPLNPLGGGFQPQKHLGGIIVGKGKDPGDPTDKNVPIQITFHNALLCEQAHHPCRYNDTGRESGDQPDSRPPARRPDPLDQRRRPLRLV